MSCDDSSEYSEDNIDPRVQVELERLNVATDEINRLEVDLDECRNNFRQLLTESTHKIEESSKRLGQCIANARPYYDARLKAKEALRETQKMAAKFERANSAHAAAKEMVFLAEEGLRTEGRTFDHAWQEMLNHATMRVNESEAERTVCELEHKRTFQLYQMADIRVQTLQKSLKKVITKSRPYFELKIHYNQLLEEQKQEVKRLEKRVADTKACYADTLKNLEQISDEIHQSRHQNKLRKQTKTGEDALKRNELKGIERSDLKSASFVSYAQPTFEDDNKTPFLTPIEAPTSESGLSKVTHTSCSSLPDTDVWSEASEPVPSADSIDRDSTLSEDESSVSFESEPYGELRSNHNIPTPPPENPLLTNHMRDASATLEVSSRQCFEGIGICSFPVPSEFHNSSSGSANREESEWTEIKLCSPVDKSFATVRKKSLVLEEDFDIPYGPLFEIDIEQKSNLGSSLLPAAKSFGIRITANKDNSDGTDKKNEEELKCVSSTPSKINNIRRQSLDVLWNAANGDKVKEILSQSIMKLNISSLNERRGIDSLKMSKESSEVQLATDEPKSLYEANLSSQFGMQFFGKKNKLENDKIKIGDTFQSDMSEGTSQSPLKTKKEKIFTKKVPSPLERTLSFLNNADDDSQSDTDSLPSVDMLTDEQLSALILDQDLSELYQDIL